MPATNHVNLGFNYGAELPDPNNLLEGTGKLFTKHLQAFFSIEMIYLCAIPDILSNTLV